MFVRTTTSRSVIVLMVVLLVSVSGPAGAQDADSVEAAGTMSLDVKDTDIRDVIRMISKGYDLNIILDKEVGGKVTLHLSDVPIMEGLTSLAESQGLAVTREGAVYRIGSPADGYRMNIRYSRGLLTADVQNANVVDMLEEVSSKSGASIVPDSRIGGTVSGKLYSVPLEDGLRALLEGNGYKVVKRKGIFRVEQPDDTRAAKAMGRRRVKPGEFFVDYSNGLLSLDVMGSDLSDVLEAVAEQADIEIVTYGKVTDYVNAKLNDVPLIEAFALLLGGTKYTFIQKENVLLVGDRNTATPSGQALSTSELIHLRHIKADDVPAILPKNIPAANIKVVKEQNALLISGTSEDIVATREFLSKIDIPTPQVVIDVIVVEYQRDLDKDFGFAFGYDPTGSSGSNSYQFPSVQVNRKGESAADLLSGLFPNVHTISELGENFYMSLRLLESEGKAKVLAQPSITVLNGNKATINVGQTQYYRIVAGTSDNPTYRFQPISFGINLDITPWISRSGQITAVITPEISNNMGFNSEGYPNIFKRSVNTTVRLEDAQTLVLGGLLRAEEQVSHNKVPVLGDIPILGYLFKSTKKLKIQTNLVLYITPTIVGRESYVDLAEEIEMFREKESRGFREDFYEGVIESANKRAMNRRRIDGVWVGEGEAPAEEIDSVPVDDEAEEDEGADEPRRGPFRRLFGREGEDETEEESLPQSIPDADTSGSSLDMEAPQQQENQTEISQDGSIPAREHGGPNALTPVASQPRSRVEVPAPQGQGDRDD
ncbi:MAG: hypothetical protein GF410_16600 [Chitinivibrionales bacterium]|nr:hypothetical protein [Chitinivibrionales bacterium]